MIWPVGVLAVLAAVAGWIQFQPFWEPITDWLDPVAEPLIEATGTQELIACVSPSASASPGSRRLARSTCAKWLPVPKRACAGLEHKFYFDELYDAVFYKPRRRARARAPALRRAAADRRLDRRGPAGFRPRLGELGRVQNGLVRSYALVLASGGRRPRRRLHRGADDVTTGSRRS